MHTSREREKENEIFVCINIKCNKNAEALFFYIFVQAGKIEIRDAYFFVPLLLVRCCNRSGLFCRFLFLWILRFFIRMHTHTLIYMYTESNRKNEREKSRKSNGKEHDFQDFVFGEPVWLSDELRNKEE